MNDYTNNNGLNVDTNLNGDGVQKMQNENVTYDSYYNHQPRKKPVAAIVVVILLLIAILISLWLAGVFTPMDRQAEYDKVYARACTAAVTYANKNNAAAKNTPGKIVYVSVKDIINANLIEASLRNYLTNEPIPVTTDLRLEVLPSKVFQCHGFVWPGDDTVKPVLTLIGESIIASSKGVKVKDPGAIATDDKDGDISDKIQRSGTVNVNEAGTYKINYFVSDRSGNLSNTVQRTYIIQ